MNRNIQSLTVQDFRDLEVNTILMSPPCQPFTRNGLKADLLDARNNSFAYLMDILPQLGIDRILVENVKGFETSMMRNRLIETLNNGGFVSQEFILNPTQFGLPNSRNRYYCLGNRNGFSFQVGPLKESLGPDLPTQNLEDFLEKDSPESHLLPDRILRERIPVLDICFKESRRSCCFTKAYTRYSQGTGSVYFNGSQAQFDKLYAETFCKTSERLSKLRNLKLRFFTPREVCRLMAFPESFTFPVNLNDRQKYMLLGNSINVKVVSELIKLMN